MSYFSFPAPVEQRLEYEKLHRALKKSHEQEKRLIKKCRELNGEIVNNAAKVQTALKLSQEDQATIGSLRKEIEKAWTMVDVAHEKEGGVVSQQIFVLPDTPLVWGARQSTVYGASEGYVLMDMLRGDRLASRISCHSSFLLRKGLELAFFLSRSAYDEAAAHNHDTVLPLPNTHPCDLHAYTDQRGWWPAAHINHMVSRRLSQN